MNFSELKHQLQNQARIAVQYYVDVAHEKTTHMAPEELDAYNQIMLEFGVNFYGAIDQAANPKQLKDNLVNFADLLLDWDEANGIYHKADSQNYRIFVQALTEVMKHLPASKIQSDTVIAFGQARAKEPRESEEQGYWRTLNSALSYYVQAQQHLGAPQGHMIAEEPPIVDSDALTIRQDFDAAMGRAEMRTREELQRLHKKPLPKDIGGNVTAENALHMAMQDADLLEDGCDNLTVTTAFLHEHLAKLHAPEKLLETQADFINEVTLRGIVQCNDIDTLLINQRLYSNGIAEFEKSQLAKDEMEEHGNVVPIRPSAWISADSTVLDPLKHPFSHKTDMQRAELAMAMTVEAIINIGPMLHVAFDDIDAQDEYVRDIAHTLVNEDNAALADDTDAYQEAVEHETFRLLGVLIQEMYPSSRNLSAPLQLPVISKAFELATASLEKDFVDPKRELGEHYRDAAIKRTRDYLDLIPMAYKDFSIDIDAMLGACHHLESFREKVTKPIDSPSLGGRF